ncbi:N-6 DNA methylase [Beijerinckia mobilis]|uniref:N-6 DNA methylase n=1 Tax=Beijerinckia mobilis TaxID=231434 RepID=UPI0012EC8DF5|nr:N-6 DNA methylase [Beijerinckia mobilis]
MSAVGCDEFERADFLDIAMNRQALPLFGDTNGPRPDAIIANPPYNCHEVNYIRDRKAQLIEHFGKSSALNMYALFVRAIIDFAPSGCLIGLVTHDSFLTATGHQDLREYIIKNCAIRNLHLCPTNLFLDQGADVRTCLLVLEKTGEQRDTVLVSNRPQTIAEFQRILRERQFESCNLSKILLLNPRDGSEFTIGVPNDVRALFDGRRLSDIAPCITGISTGDDKKYIREAESAEFQVPFYKNPASRRFFAAPDGYLCTNFQEIGRKVPNFMIRNKSLILQGGIACSSMGVKFGATIRPENTACGVNPNIIIEHDDKWWLLSFLNSRLCLYLTRGIIIRANMITAGYASRIPTPEFDSATKETLALLGQEGFAAAKGGASVDLIKSRIDDAVETSLGLPREVRELLASFERDPIRLS